MYVEDYYSQAGFFKLAGPIIDDVDVDAAVLARWACGGDEWTKMGRRWRSVHGGSWRRLRMFRN
jgi:hypothetical protein